MVVSQPCHSWDFHELRLPLRGVVAMLIAAGRWWPHRRRYGQDDHQKPFVSGMKEIGQAAADSIFGGRGSAEMVARGNQFRDTIAHTMLSPHRT